MVTEGLFLQEVLRVNRTVFHDGAGWGHCPKQNSLHLAIVRRKKVEYRKGTTSSSWPEDPAWSTPIYHSNTISYHPSRGSQDYSSSLIFRFLPSQALSCLRAFALAASFSWNARIFPWLTPSHPMGLGSDVTPSSPCLKKTSNPHHLV